MKDLISFLAIWFNHLKSFTWKVNVSDPGNRKELVSLSKDLAKVDSGIKGIIKAIGKLEEKDDNVEVKKLLERIIESVSRKIEFPKIEIPKEVKVSNFPIPTQFPKSVEVSNFPKTEFPKSVEVSNFPSFPEFKDIKFPKLQEVKGKVEVLNQINLGEVINGLQTVVDVINELRLEMPKALTTGITTSSQSTGKNVEYKTNNVDTTSQANIVYVGKESKVGDWIISKIDTSAISMIYATSSNNKNRAGYSEAWSARTSLTYSVFSIAR